MSAIIDDKKIIIVTPFFSPNLGGVETHLKYYTDYLAANNVKAAVLTYKPLISKVKEWKKYEKNNTVEVYRFWWWGQSLFDKLADNPTLEFLYMVPKLLFHTLIYSVINRKKIQCYHAHGLIAAFIVRITALIIKRRMIVNTHFIYNLKERPFFTKIFLWIFNGFDKVLAVGEESKNDLLAVGYPANKIEIYRHSINQKLFKIKDRQELRNKFSFKNEDTIVLFVGRLLTMKGVEKLVRTAEKNNDIKFIFLGAGELEDYLTEAAKRLSNVLFFGKKFGEELVDIYNLADMVILPSTQEGASLVVVEALSCGKPVIVTKYGCSKDMFPDELGKKIEPNEEEIIKAIRELRGENLEELSKKCRSYAELNYGQNNLLKILHCCLYE
jgi:glycosyltransferase involved in cell wall biosynthesis